MIRILITDDCWLWRVGIRTLLERDYDIDIVGEARDGQEAINLAEQLAPDVVLMDIQMPRVDGLKATEQISARRLKTRVLMFAGMWEEALVRQAVQNGAKGYLPKDVQPDELLSAVHAVYEDKTFFDPRVSHWLTSTTPAA